MGKASSLWIRELINWQNIVKMRIVTVTMSIRRMVHNIYKLMIPQNLINAITITSMDNLTCATVSSIPLIEIISKA